MADSQYPFLSGFGYNSYTGRTNLLYQDAWPTTEPKPLKYWFLDDPNRVGTAGAIIIGTQPSPSDRPGEMSFRVNVCDPKKDDVFYLYPCCPSVNAIGPVVCKYTYKGNTVWETQIDADTAISQIGSNVSVNAWDEFVLICCADHTAKFVKAAVGSVGEEFSWAVSRDPSTGLYYGLGHNNPSNGAWFDGFAITNLRADGGLICADCWCMCQQYAVDRQVLATFVTTDLSTNNRAACLNGLNFPMNWYWRKPVGQWEGGYNYVRGASTHYLPFILRCDGSSNTYPGQNWSLTWTTPVSICSDPGKEYLCASTDSVCDPLRLVFGPYHIGRTNLGCYLCYDPFPVPGPENGYFNIEITDP